MSVLYQEALGHLRPSQLRPECLNTVHDLLLVADQGDADSQQVAHGQMTGLVHGGDAGLQEGRDVAFHLDGHQPLLHTAQLGHVWHVGVHQVVGAAVEQEEVLGLLWWWQRFMVLV